MRNRAALRFEGFSPEALTFLRGLAQHNERPWFEARRDVYETELLGPLRSLVEDAASALRSAKIPLGGTAKRSVFRIYRDVRFGHDKTPYKTHLSAYLSYDGEKGTPGGLYVHVQPRASMIAAAFYAIDRPLLQRWRAELAAKPARFRTVLRTLAKRGLALDGPETWDDALARMPRGFEALAEHELAPYLRLKSFVVRQMLTDEIVSSRALVDRIVSLAKDARPFLEFGWSLE